MNRLEILFLGVITVVSPLKAVDGNKVGLVKMLYSGSKGSHRTLSFGVNRGTAVQSLVGPMGVIVPFKVVGWSG